MSRQNMIPCPSCGIDNNILSRKQQKELTCFNCGSDLKLAIEKYDKENPEKPVKVPNKNQQTVQKDITQVKSEQYPSLKLIAKIYRILAWVIGIGAIIAFVYGFDLLGDRYNKDAGVLIIVLSIVTGTLGVIFTLAVSEGIVLFVNIANDVNAIKNRK